MDTKISDKRALFPKFLTSKYFCIWWMFFFHVCSIAPNKVVAYSAVLCNTKISPWFPLYIMNLQTIPIWFYQSFAQIDFTCRMRWSHLSHNADNADNLCVQSCFEWMFSLITLFIKYIKLIAKFLMFSRSDEEMAESELSILKCEQRCRPFSSIANNINAIAMGLIYA